MPRAYRAPGKVLDVFQRGKGESSYKQIAYIRQISATLKKNDINTSICNEMEKKNLHNTPSVESGL